MTKRESVLPPDLKAKMERVLITLGTQVNPKLAEMLASDGSPRTLCHYTDFAGLKGILETGRLWATYGKTLNDSTEQTYGEQVLLRYVRQKGLPVQTLQRMEGGAINARRNFVVCFCENTRVLSM